VSLGTPYKLNIKLEFFNHTCGCETQTCGCEAPNTNSKPQLQSKRVFIKGTCNVGANEDSHIPNTKGNVRIPSQSYKTSTLMPMGSLLVDNSIRSQTSFFSKAAIYSTMAFSQSFSSSESTTFQSFSSYESTASLTVLGSSSIIRKTKFELNQVEHTFPVVFFPEQISSILKYEALLLIILVLL
jgi:hypothetical protein